jgi:glyoxylate reductase
MKVLITREIPQAGLNILHQYKNLEIDYRQGIPMSEKELKKAIVNADALIPVVPDGITKEIIQSAKQLKIIAAYSVGYDHIDVEYATKKNIYVANTPGDLTENVAEHAFALLMSLARRIVEADEYCRKGDYKYWDPMRFIGPKLTGKTIGIIGFGRIGQYMARICKYGLNMKILYNDVLPHPEAESLLDAERVNLDDLLENSDVISIHCNLTEQTRGLINEIQFRKMKPLAYLINTSRGAIINEQALANALKQGWIAGAGLDVFEKEPTIGKELIERKNVVLTPHIASATWESRIQMARMASENVIDVLVNNSPPRYIVNKELLIKPINSIA